MSSGTLCMTANQFLGTHYNLHSLYGLTEANTTMNALTTILNKRSLVISRSTYPGSGAHGGHWLGDNASERPDLAISIPGILQFSIFGIPLVGADICGFNGNTTQELCTRWQQLGAFYPFSKNHNSLDSIVDNNTWDLDTQFMWGSALLISPVLTESTSSVKAYFPEGRWFNFRTTPNTTTAQSLMNNYTLLIAPDGTGSASGYLYLDDGESLNTDLDNGFTLLQFTLNNSIFTRTVLSSGYTGADEAVVDVGKQTMLG
ncbi:hypothetical protein EMCRGX_G015493 [Ephydatia muelleri]